MPTPQTSASTSNSKGQLKIVIAAVVILATVGWLTFTGISDNKSYYVTISELNAMGTKAYTRHLRVAGNVAPGTTPTSTPIKPTTAATALIPTK